MDAPKKAYIKTFGCQMNMHDSEKMAGMLLSEGYELTDERKDADLIVFNTCSIRQKAEQKFLSDLGRIKGLKKRNTALRIAVAGCIAKQMGHEIFRRAPYVDYVLGPQNIHALGNMLRNGGSIAVEENPGQAGLRMPVERKGRVKAWVSIMFGCDNFCTYCIVPYTRGREKSRPSDDIAREVESLVAEGRVEVTLLGQNVNSYRSDTDFPGLLEKINNINGLKRIRFVTSHPRDLSGSLVNAMASLEKVCEHIHLPLQSGSDRVLSAMNRGYTFREYEDKVNNLRYKIKDVAITSDFIAGFPAESEEEHMETLRVLGEVGFDGVFALRYSPRPGTVASTMEGQIDEGTGLRRLREILETQDGITGAINRRLEGTVQEVLVEGPSETDPGRLTGRTRANKIVNFRGGGDLVGSIVGVGIRKAGKHSLEGEDVQGATGSGPDQA
jgi:tRNA-2-methylthio-N6-dimethylallyladenosine synthase